MKLKALFKTFSRWGIDLITVAALVCLYLIKPKFQIVEDFFFVLVGLIALIFTGLKQVLKLYDENNSFELVLLVCVVVTGVGGYFTYRQAVEDTTFFERYAFLWPNVVYDAYVERCEAKSGTDCTMVGGSLLSKESFYSKMRLPHPDYHKVAGSFFEKGCKFEDTIGCRNALVFKCTFKDQDGAVKLAQDVAKNRPIIWAKIKADPRLACAAGGVTEENATASAPVGDQWWTMSPALEAQYENAKDLESLRVKLQLPKNFIAFAYDYPDCVQQIYKPTSYFNDRAYQSVMTGLQVGSPSSRYAVFEMQTVCKIKKFEESFKTDPNTFCSNVDLVSMPSCYYSLLHGVSLGNGLSPTGVTLMSGIAMQWMLEHKDKASPDEQRLAFIEVSSVTLQYLMPFSLVDGSVFIQPKQRADQIKHGYDPIKEVSAIDTIISGSSRRMAANLIAKVEPVLLSLKSRPVGRAPADATFNSRVQNDYLMFERLKNYWDHVK